MMKSRKLWGVGLCLTAVLVQSACGTDNATVQSPAAPTNPGVPTDGSAKSGRSTIAKVLDSFRWSDKVILPEGTVLVVRTTSTLSTKTQVAGQTFTGTLEKPLLQDGQEIASTKGTNVVGKIVDADDGGRVKGVASLAVQLSSIEVGNESIPISTNTLTRNAKSTKTDDAVKIGIGAGIGAAIGAIAGGGKGAAIGAGAGGAAGTGVVLATHGEPAVIPSESLLTFKLRAPVTVAIPKR